jgi:zinc transporter ZupT
MWNGLTAWFVFLAHVIGAWDGFPVYNAARGGNWYDFGFLLGAGSPLLGAFGRKNRSD